MLKQELTKTLGVEKESYLHQTGTFGNLYGNQFYGFHFLACAAQPPSHPNRASVLFGLRAQTM